MSSAKKKHQDYEALLKNYEQAQTQLARTQLREKTAKKSLKAAEKKDASKSEIEILRLELNIAKAKRKVRKAEANLSKAHIKQWIKANAKHEKSYRLTIYEKAEEPEVTIAQPVEEVKAKRPYNRRAKTDAETSNTRAIESAPEVPETPEGKAGVSSTEEVVEETRELVATEVIKSRRPRRSSAEVAAEKEAAQAALREGGEDFSIIEGIGPAVTKLLHSEGIKTFSALAASDVDAMRALMKSRRNNIADPTTWAQQAQLVVDNDWESLKQLQESLKRPRS